MFGRLFAGLTQASEFSGVGAMPDPELEMEMESEAIPVEVETVEEIVAIVPYGFWTQTPPTGRTFQRLYRKHGFSF